MTLMRIREVSACDAHRRAIVVLEAASGDERLTFSADPDEARRLAQELARGPAACHPVFDFVRGLLAAFDAHTVRIVIEDVNGQGVGGLVCLRRADGDVAVPCYPPDALALALRTGVPIYATPEALGRAGGPPAHARDEEVARWLDELKPDDFARGPQEG